MCDYIKEFITDIEQILDEVEKLECGRYLKFFKAYFSIDNTLKKYVSARTIPETSLVYLFLKEDGEFYYEFNDDLLYVVEECLELNIK